jgi:hypothetical protein
VNLLSNFESICEHMVEKFGNKDAKKTNFSKSMVFRKKSNIFSSLSFSIIMQAVIQNSNYPAIPLTVFV